MYRKFLSKRFPILVVKFSIYLNRGVFVMIMPVLITGYNSSILPILN